MGTTSVQAVLDKTYTLSVDLSVMFVFTHSGNWEQISQK